MLFVAFGALVLVPQNKALIVSIITLATTIGVSLLAKGMARLIPILIGIVVGYLVSIPLGLIDLSPIARTPWFAVPGFVLPHWNMQAVLFIVPVAIAPAIGHFGAITVVGLNALVKAGEDLTEPRNLSIVALILVFGIGGMAFSINESTLKGIGLVGITGVILNLVLPRSKKGRKQDETSENVESAKEMSAA